MNFYTTNISTYLIYCVWPNTTYNK
jgi:hypothetical protein